MAPSSTSVLGTVDDFLEQEADRVAAQAADWLQPSSRTYAPTQQGLLDGLGEWFGYDFSRVRIHADDVAARAVGHVGAMAWTAGIDVAIGSEAPGPTSYAGRRFLAHELAHVVQQQGGTNESRSKTGSISPAPAGVPQPQFVTPLGPGGGYGGVMDRDRARVRRATQELHFFHGTSWEIARTIPGQVRPLGGGDFAAGFYTHHDRNNRRGKDRAKTWGMRIARSRREPYAGVLDFAVQGSDYAALLGGGRSVDFALTSRDQSDYTARQRRWLDFVTTHGRETSPTYDRRLSVWRHERRDPQPHLAYNVVSGPFYRGIRGRPGTPPGRDEFHPYAEGRTLPQQVVFANQGIDLLNSARVRTSLEQYDAHTGDRIDPPQQTPPGPAAHTPATAPPMVPPTEPLR